MKKRNGFTLLELLICISLISVVIVFLFKLINTVRNDERAVGYIRENQVNRNELMRSVGIIASEDRICSYDSTGSTDDKAVIVFNLCNNKIMKLTVTRDNAVVEYDGTKTSYPMKDEKAWYDPKFTVTSGNYYDYEYTKITFKTDKKGLPTTPLDDIEVYWISGGLGIYAAQLRYSNPLTTCKNAQCAIDELSILAPNGN